VLVDTLDGMVRAGAITEASRAGAEISAWSTVHGFASLLVGGGVLGAGDVERTYPAVLRTLLLGLGVSPELALRPRRPLEQRPPSTRAISRTPGS
jgi:hypothetical protein